MTTDTGPDGDTSDVGTPAGTPADADEDTDEDIDHDIDGDAIDDADVLRAFRLIDRRLATAPDSWSPRLLRPLRDRLAGELIGDADRVGRTLGPAFTLVTHAGGTSTTTDRAGIVETIRRQGQAKGAAMTWLRLADLVVDRDTIAGQGVLRTLLAGPLAARQGWRDVAPADRCLTTIPIAFFLRFADGLMVSEIL